MAAGSAKAAPKVGKSLESLDRAAIPAPAAGCRNSAGGFAGRCEAGWSQGVLRSQAQEGACILPRLGHGVFALPARFDARRSGAARSAARGRPQGEPQPHRRRRRRGLEGRGPGRTDARAPARRGRNWRCSSALADLGGVWDVVEVTAALTAFADAAVGAAARFVLAEAGAAGQIDACRREGSGARLGLDHPRHGQARRGRAQLFQRHRPDRPLRSGGGEARRGHASRRCSSSG